MSGLNFEKPCELKTISKCSVRGADVFAFFLSSAVNAKIESARLARFPFEDRGLIFILLAISADPAYMIKSRSANKTHINSSFSGLAKLSA